MTETTKRNDQTTKQQSNHKNNINERKENKNKICRKTYFWEKLLITRNNKITTT